MATSGSGAGSSPVEQPTLFESLASITLTDSSTPDTSTTTTRTQAASNLFALEYSTSNVEEEVAALRRTVEQQARQLNDQARAFSDQAQAFSEQAQAFSEQAQESSEQQQMIKDLRDRVVELEQAQTLEDDQLDKVLSECWTKIMIALNQLGIQALLDILRNDSNGLPKDPAQLYNALKKYEPRLGQFRSDRTRMEKLFPTNKQTDSEDFDIPMLVDILIICRIVEKPNKISLPGVQDILAGVEMFPPTFNSTQPNRSDALKWLKTFRNMMDHHGKKKACRRTL